MSSSFCSKIFRADVQRGEVPGFEGIPVWKKGSNLGSQQIFCGFQIDMLYIEPSVCEMLRSTLVMKGLSEA